MSAMSDVQALFTPLPDTVRAIQTTLSPARFNRYLVAADYDLIKALALYRWNSHLGQNLYWPIQTLEIALRNSISNLLKIRFGENWHTLTQRPPGNELSDISDL